MLGLPVLSQRTEVVSPLESAIDLISSRVAAIKKELGKNNYNTNSINNNYDHYHVALIKG